MDRTTSLNVIRLSGGYAVKVRPGTKAAYPGWAPGQMTPARSAQVATELESTDDNIACHFHGKLVDVDVDSDSSVLLDALDWFLPVSSHVWGRGERLRTHRMYQLMEDYEPSKHAILQRIKRLCKVEVRGGPKSRGEYTLMPGSVHPSGDVYAWDNASSVLATPTVVDIGDLLKGIRLAGAVSILAPVWVEGVRQEATLALAGFLHRVHDLSQSLDTFGLSLEDSIALVESLCRLVGDDQGDSAMRVAAVRATWNKAESGVAVTGAKTLANLAGDSSLVSALYALLTDSPEVELIDTYVERFAIWQGQALVVDREALRMGAVAPFMTRNKFRDSYGHLYVDVAGKRKLLPEMLWSMSAVTRVAGLTFQPDKDELVDERDGRKLNVWSGFSIDPVEGATPTRFLDYLYEIICSNNDEYYSWVMAWLAHIFQEPSNKAGTALVLVGRSGIGKSFLGHQILGQIIGNRHYAVTNSIDNVVSHFNASYSNRLLIQCDEAINARQRAAALRLRSLITDPMQRVEPKGVDAYFVPLHARFLFTSNETEEAIHLDQGYDDRRYTILEVSDKYKNGLDSYWLPFVEWLEEPDTLPSIHYHLLQHKYERSLIRIPLKSAAKERMQQRTWSLFDSWLASMLTRNHPLSVDTHKHWFDAPVGDSREIMRTGWPKWVSIQALELDYAHYSRGSRGEQLNAGQISRALVDRGLLSDDVERRRLQVSSYDARLESRVVSRIRVTKCFSRETLAKFLKTRYGFEDGEYSAPIEYIGSESEEGGF